MKIELEKLENYKGVAVKALLNSSATGLFIDAQFTKRKRSNLERLKTLLLVRNIDGTVNIEGAITYQVECNMFFKEYIERVRINVCNLERIEVILGMPWLAVYNLEIDWKKREIKITKCPFIYGKKKQGEKEKGSGGVGAKKILEIKKSVWKSRVRKNASTKSLGSHNQVKRRLYV